jgi:hypothetical protein
LSSKSKTETWVIIVKITKELRTVEEPNPMLGKFGLPIRKVIDDGTKEEEINRFPIKEPTLIIPNGGSIEKVEVIPITKPLVIHTKNMRRRLFP